MKTHFNNYAVIVSFNLLFLSPVSVWAQHTYEFTPAISVGGTYDDNLYRNTRNERSDYITAYTPSIDLDIQAQKTDFSLSYAPSFVFYNEYTANDTTRHSATVAWVQDLTQHMRLHLSDTYYKSEEPEEYDETFQGVRLTRRPYWRNIGDGRLEFLFGPENAITLGYVHNEMENEDPTLDDGSMQNPYASLAFWFNEKNGIELDYRYTDADYWQDIGVVRDDYKGDAGGIRYIRRLSSNTSFFVQYNLATRDFDGLTEDYDIQEGSAGFSHAFSAETSITLSGGYFVRDREYSGSQDGIKYNLSFTTQSERGRFRISGDGGWDESYMGAEQWGFTKYYSGSARMDYQIQENLTFNMSGSYRQDTQEGVTKREWSSWRGNMGLSWSFFRYFSLALDYRYVQRSDDIDLSDEMFPPRDYASNQVTLTLRASRLFRW